MQARIELVPEPLTDLESDGAPAFPILRAIGAAPRMALAAADGERFGMAPGEYCFEARVRALEGGFAPRLIAKLVGGGEAEAPATEVAPGVWRATLVLDRAADVLELCVDGAGAFVFGRAEIRTEVDEPAPAPTLRAAFVTGARALFRKLPHTLRRALLSSRRRAAWLARVRRGGGGAAPASSGGRFVAPSGDADRFRADFENRFGVARARARDNDADPAPAPASDVKLVAFHLPQFHPIPENDAWWGAGFTEWSNVSKAVPQFVGHHQPRLPGELGFYDLRAPGVLARQAALARAYGVGAFCFHYYWFAGKRLLEAPLDAVLADRGVDIDFCLCWANENWTRRWDGDESEVLIAQQHTLEDHARVFDDLVRYAEDPRYLRIDGKPLLVVYRPDIIANAREMTAIWREAADKRGWPGVYLVATSAFLFDDPASFGFDALAEFPPHGFVGDRIEARLLWLNERHAGAVYDYAATADAEARRMQAARAAAHTVFPGVMPGWDNEARRPGAGAIYHGSTPEAYGAWLQAAIERARRTLPADRRLVFINAWNEWAEGAYLEPDRAFGRAYLKETARVISAR